jgi:integrase
LGIRNHKKSGKLSPRAVAGFKEKKALSRRRHQEGELLKLQHGWSVRFYEDYFDKGGRQRRRVQKFLGDFNKLPTKRSAQNALSEEMAPVNSLTIRPRTTQTFREAASIWIRDCETRKWKPVKPSVLRNWKSILANHVLPVLGDTPLCDVRNQAMRRLVERLSGKGLSPATIKNITLVVKLTVASAVDEDGNALYAVKWNSRFIDAPCVDPTKQHRPVFTAEQVGRIVNAATGRMQVAVILLACSGLRAGELCGLERKHFDGSALHIEQEVWGGQVLPPKTPNSRRVIDLHPDAADLIKQFIGDRSTGFILSTRTGKPMNQRNLMREFYKVLESLEIPQSGFHSFRRFRNTFLRNSRCPDGLLKFWMGHANRDMSDHYDRVREDVQFRRDVAKSVGVGFELPKSLTSKQLNRKGKKRRSKATKIPISGVIGRQGQLQAAAEAVVSS